MVKTARKTDSISGILTVGAVVMIMAQACGNTDAPAEDNVQVKQSKVALKESVPTLPEQTITQNTDFPTVPEELSVSPEKESPQQPESTEGPAVSEGYPEIVSIKFTSGVSERNPVDELQVVPLSLQRIFTHTVVSSSRQDSIVHVYKFDGEEVARVPMKVGASPTWRTWSSKYLDPLWVGNWTVEIQSVDGTVLAQKSFEVVDEKDSQDSESNQQGAITDIAP